MPKVSIFKRIKKANLHLHITGSLTPNDIRYLAKSAKVQISIFEPLERHLSFFDPLIWAAAKEVTSTNLGLLGAMKIIIDREIDDNVTLLEITINVAGMIRRGMLVDEITHTFRQAIDYGNTNGLTCKVKLGVNRKDGPESVSVVKNLYLNIPREYRSGIDLNGDEKVYPTAAFISVFKRLSDEQIPTTIHAGEYLNLTKSIWEALSTNPKRIVHAVAAANDDRLLEKIRDSDVVIEVSLISNLFTGSIASLSEHPIRKFIDYNIPVVFGSDDPAIFQKNMTDQYDALLLAGLDTKQIIYLNETSFSLSL